MVEQRPFKALVPGSSPGQPTFLKHPLRSRVVFDACREIGRAYSLFTIQTVEAIVDERGVVRLLEPVQLGRRRRALVTILADEPSEAHERALLSEASLAEDWNRPEEDAAWAQLQQAP
jgi:hypothetical protein